MIRVPALRTARLDLVPLAADHTRAVADLFADPAMSAHLGADLSDRAAAEEMVRRRLAYGGPDGLGHWALLHGGRVAGLAHLRPSAELPGGLCEIGWYVGSAYAGAGLATEAARALIRYGLADLRLDAVWALVHVDNTASLRVAARLGLLDVGRGFHYGGEHRVLVGLPGLLRTGGAEDDPRPGRAAGTSP
jgi:RimJ/RimL family protein N-acetyltransferase